MNTLTIDGIEHEINDDVANLVLLISKERDELKKTLTENSEPSANLPCSDGLDSLVEQAIEALEKLASYHQTTKKYLDAISNREYIKVIEGQQISHRLVEERKNS